MCLCLVAQSCPTLCNPVDCRQSGSSVHGDFPGKNIAVGCHALLQGILPTQRSNPSLLHCRRILYCLSHQGSHSQSHYAEVFMKWFGFICYTYRVFTGKSINYRSSAIIASEILALCEVISLELCSSCQMIISCYYLSNKKQLFLLFSQNIIPLILSVLSTCEDSHTKRKNRPIMIFLLWLSYYIFKFFSKIHILP